MRLYIGEATYDMTRVRGSKESILPIPASPKARSIAIQVYHQIVESGGLVRCLLGNSRNEL
jgi:hypothetical protein